MGGVFGAVDHNGSARLSGRPEPALIEIMEKYRLQLIDVDDMFAAYLKAERELREGEGLHAIRGAMKALRGQGIDPLGFAAQFAVPVDVDDGVAERDLAADPYVNYLWTICKINVAQQMSFLQYVKLVTTYCMMGVDDITKCNSSRHSMTALRSVWYAYACACC